MKTLIPLALAGALLLTALPGGAQSATPTPTPTPSASATPSASPSPTPTASATPDATLQQAGPALTFAGRGLTNGLSLTIAGQGLQSGVTGTRVANAATEDCTGVACATAAGIAPPIGEFATATSPGAPGPDVVEMFNIAEDAGPLAQVVDGTVDTSTAQTSDAPFATGTAGAVTLDVTLTQTIVGQLPAEVTDGLTGGLGQLGDALSPISDADPTGIIGGLTDTLEELVGDLGSGPLARVQAAQSVSSSDFETGVVSAQAQAAGAVVTLLPTPGSSALLPEGLAVIEVGPSRASATANGTDRATTDAAASIARITLLPGVLDGLPGLDPGAIDELPLDDILDLLPPEVTDLLPIDDLLPLGFTADGDQGPEGETTEGETTDGETSQTPVEDQFGGFMQADDNSMGFVIDLETGTEPVCILEGTPLETCVTLGGTSETFTADGLGVGVLAAGVELSLLRGAGEVGAPVEPGTGLIELVVGRSEAGVAAAFVQAPAPTPIPTPTTTPLPQTGGASTLVLPSLLLMGLSGVALVGLRRRRDA